MKKLRSTLSFALVIAMLPVFLSIFCPCVHAAPSQVPVYQNSPCHDGCCPELNTSPRCQIAILTSSLGQWVGKTLPFTGMLFKKQALPASTEVLQQKDPLVLDLARLPDKDLSCPLFLKIQVLRI